MITDLRINAKGELEGKVISPAKWEEMYTKEEVIAMLTEIQLEIEKQCKIPNDCASAYDWNNGVYACYKVIQQKINELKENTDGRN